MSNELQKAKSIFLSKRFWLNTVAFLIALIELINPGILLAIGIPAENQKNVLLILGAVVAALNQLLLRFGNNQPVRVGLTKLITKKDD